MSAPDLSHGYKADAGKTRLDLLDPHAIELLGRVLTFGAAKYQPHNWRKGMDWSRCYAAALRHLSAFWAGEDLDPESGLPHLAHAMCCVMFLTSYQAEGNGHDDRWRPSPRPVPKAVLEGLEMLRSFDDGWRPSPDQLTGVLGHVCRPATSSGDCDACAGKGEIGSGSYAIRCGACNPEPETFGPAAVFGAGT